MQEVEKWCRRWSSDAEGRIVVQEVKLWSKRWWSRIWSRRWGSGAGV